MTDMLLDATVFDDLRRGNSGARELIESILDGKVEAAVSPMTVCEIWHRGDIDRQIEIGFLSVLRFVEEVPPDIDTARRAGLWLANYTEDGRRDATYVVIVAATARQFNIPVCTRDAEAFERFGVETITY